MAVIMASQHHQRPLLTHYEPMHPRRRGPFDAETQDSDYDGQQQYSQLLPPLAAGGVDYPHASTTQRQHHQHQHQQQSLMSTYSSFPPPPSQFFPFGQYESPALTPPPWQPTQPPAGSPHHLAAAPRNHDTPSPAVHVVERPWKRPRTGGPAASAEDPIVVDSNTGGRQPPAGQEVEDLLNEPSDDEEEINDQEGSAEEGPSPGRRNKQTKKKASASTTRKVVLVKVTWIKQMDEALINTLCQCVRDGLRSNGTFRPEAWKLAVSAVKATSSSKVADRITVKRCQNKLCNHRTLWQAFRKMQENTSGWGVNADGIAYADPDTMEAYLEKFPARRILTVTGLPFREELDELFVEVTANGDHAVSGQRRPPRLPQLDETVEDDNSEVVGPSASVEDSADRALTSDLHPLDGSTPSNPRKRSRSPTKKSFITESSNSLDAFTTALQRACDVKQHDWFSKASQAFWKHAGDFSDQAMAAASLNIAANAQLFAYAPAGNQKALIRHWIAEAERLEMLHDSP